LACDEVKVEIEKIAPSEGKMFGVLVAENSEGQLGFLAAYSGLLEGRNDWEYFVPPVFDAQQPDGYFKQKEREISALNQHPTPDTQHLNRQM
jgi:tRNA pseudouridine32 synthase/23S rRNA pseudouridine746 synthase